MPASAFPCLGMEGFPRAWGAILPLRWYMQILFDQAARGARRCATRPNRSLSSAVSPWFSASWCGCASARSSGHRLCRAEMKPARRSARDRPASAGAFAAEWRRVLGDRGVSRPVRAGAGALRVVSIRSRTWVSSCATFRSRWWTRIRAELGRGLIQALEAHGNISIALRASSYRRGGGRDLRTPRFWYPRHSTRYGEERAERRDGAAADLCRFDLFHSVQSLAAGSA